MRDILRAIFKPLPKPGEVFSFDDRWDKDPFGKIPHQVEVIETKHGWVRYKIIHSLMFIDERMSRSCFHFCYKKMPNGGNYGMETDGEWLIDSRNMAERCGAVKDARDALHEAIKIRCTCSGFVIQYEGSCVCARGKVMSAAENNLTQAIDAL